MFKTMKTHNARIAALCFGATLIGGGHAVAQQQVFASDVDVQGSLCVGFDCTANESFGFDTVKLKENNLRIFFQDTSVAAGFPANSWRLIANDSVSGGANYFALEDSTAARQVFRVDAGARLDSIHVDSVGNVGFGTATPSLTTHARSGNTPGQRLEQDGSGGFTPQTWDVAGNEANFFVRDVTGGSRLPFRIRPGAPTSSIDIAASGNVGLGTASPANKLTMLTSSNAFGLEHTDGNVRLTTFVGTGSVLGGWLGTVTNHPLSLFTNNAGARLTIATSGNVGIGTTTPANKLTVQTSSNAVGLEHTDGTVHLTTFVGSGSNSGGWVGTASNHPLNFFTNNNAAQLMIATTGNVGIGTSAPTAQLHTTGSVRFAGVANCASGIVSNASGDLSCLVSSRQFKNVAGDLAPETALANVMALRPQTGAYKETPDVPEHWLIAEDVAHVDRALVGLRDGEPYTVKVQGVVADLVAVVQQQQRHIEALEQALASRSSGTR
jgi:hypothetical protein